MGQSLCLRPRYSYTHQDFYFCFKKLIVVVICLINFNFLNFLFLLFMRFFLVQIRGFLFSLGRFFHLEVRSQVSFPVILPCFMIVKASFMNLKAPSFYYLNLLQVHYTALIII